MPIADIVNGSDFADLQIVMEISSFPLYFLNLGQQAFAVALPLRSH
jgi:hypothetical protein